jgi:hypothetical protein
MANIHTVLEAIIDNGTSGAKVKIDVENRDEFENLRTNLVKQWTKHRTVILAVGDDSDPLANLSLCATYNKQECAGFFWLGAARRREARQYSFSIVPPVEPANDEHPTISIVSRTPKVAE